MSSSTKKNIPVLVVEDEPLLRMDLVDNLEDAGFIVFDAANAQAAIDILVEHGEIRLVMTDVDMPGGMDGIRLAAYVRDKWPPLKIIVVSGYRQVSMDELPSESRFFSKPYDPRRLIRSMHEMLAAA
ncbi:response regulator [Rhizobium sp. SYY.PMSO]|uniref:response regulator n=1 Tax=Rhizobium sp. SYY.PMSO TaxID=3382192 RepID=UPI000DDBC83A